jgi:hypothetical protein
MWYAPLQKKKTLVANKLITSSIKPLSKCSNEVTEMISFPSSCVPSNGRDVSNKTYLKQLTFIRSSYPLPLMRENDYCSVSKKPRVDTKLERHAKAKLLP